MPNQLSSCYGELTVLVTREYLFQHGVSFWKQGATFLFSVKIYNSECVVQDALVAQEVFYYCFSTSTPPPSHVLRTNEEGNIIYQRR